MMDCNLPLVSLAILFVAVITGRFVKLFMYVLYTFLLSIEKERRRCEFNWLANGRHHHGFGGPRTHNPYITRRTPIHCMMGLHISSVGEYFLIDDSNNEVPCVVQT